MAKKEVEKPWKPTGKFYPSSPFHKVAHYGAIEIRQDGYIAKSEEEEKLLLLAASNPKIPIVGEGDRPLPVTKDESDGELKKLRNMSKTLQDEKDRLLAEMEAMRAEMESLTSPK